MLDILKEVRQKRQDDWRSVNAIVNNHGDWFLDLTDKIRLPEWFSPEKEDVGQAVKLLDLMLDMAAVLYVESDQVNDFFYLNGVTGIKISLFGFLTFCDQLFHQYHDETNL